MTPDLCIYHGNCADGFGAAWAVRHAFGDQVEFHAGVYQDPPPDVTGRSVVIVDFSYKRPVIEQMARQARSILVLDHHKSAFEDLMHLPVAPSWDDWIGESIALRYNGNLALAALFDLRRSGAGIAWDYFHPAVPRPKLINHIEDRDLWRFELPGTREIQAAVFSYPYDWATWDWLMLEADIEQLRLEGEAIERKHHKDVAELIKVVTRPMKFLCSPNDRQEPLGFLVVPVANLPYTLTSDAGHLLCGYGHPFAGCYWDTPDGRVFSLRSREGGADVGAIAKRYGGGGHKHAAGFRVPYDQLGQFEVEG